MAAPIAALRPLVPADLLHGLERFLSSMRRPKGAKEHVRIGVCVSGGPDSMALAYLLKNLDDDSLPCHLTPTALIVNHNARPGSDLEAEYIAIGLRRHGIMSKIIDMEWPTTSVSASNIGFEMLARRKRYRMLAETAIKLRLQHLFLGHHQDDQIETIIMRLVKANSASFLGLQGISHEAAVPYCEDIWAMRTGRQEQCLSNVLSNSVEVNSSNSGCEIKTNRSDTFVGINTAKDTVKITPKARMQLFRPLLDFPKPRLVDTCTANGIHYVYDKTNDDPSITLRNAVRYMRKFHTLPVALRDQSILRLCQKSRSILEKIQAKGLECARVFRVWFFDIRSGSMIVQIPHNLSQIFEIEPLAVSNALSRLIRTIAPDSDGQTNTLAPWDQVKDFMDRFSTSSSLSIGQVYFHPVVDASSEQESGALWRLSRKPINQLDFARLSQTFCLDKSNDNQGIWSEYLFWDSRYWISIRTSSARTLSRFGIRPYQASDASSLREILSKNQRRNLDKLLGGAAPGKIRYTLPVLTFDGEIIAFPTLNFMLDRIPRRYNDTILTRPGNALQENYINEKTPSLTSELLLDTKVNFKPVVEPFLVRQNRLTVPEIVENITRLNKGGKLLNFSPPD